MASASWRIKGSCQSVSISVREQNFKSFQGGEQSGGMPALMVDRLAWPSEGHSWQSCKSDAREITAICEGWITEKSLCVEQAGLAAAAACEATARKSSSRFLL
jgi:hypothetical protein